MRYLTFFSGFILLSSLSSTSYAEKQNNSYQLITTNLILNNPQFKPLVAFNQVRQTDHENILAFAAESKIQSNYTAGIVSIETGLTPSQHIANQSKYYFSGEITLHRNNAFNLFFTASIEQTDPINVSYYHAPVLESSPNINETELNYRYGLIGSYSVNSTWHFSGGIIHSPTSNIEHEAIFHHNSHMALVGTTYSF